MSAVVLGVDASTTAVKAIVWDTRGAALAEGRASIALSSPVLGAYEQDANEWWSATVSAIRAALAGCGGARVEALAIACQRETFVFTDDEGAPLAPALTWMDARCSADVARAVAAIGEARLHAIGGKPASPTPSLYKAMFLLRTRPELARARPWMLDVHAFLVRRLTGAFRTSTAAADPTGLVELATSSWSRELAALVGLEVDRLPALVAPGESLGTIDAAAARATGLPIGLPLIAGAGDGQAAALGAGVVDEGRAYLNVGTAIVSGTPSRVARIDRRFRTLFASHPGAFLLETDLLGGTFSFNWLAEKFFPREPRAAVLDRLLVESADLPPGACGLVFLPYLGGVMTPYWDDAASGALIGLRGHHGARHVYRAIAEGLALEQRLATEGVESALGPIAELVVLGGPLRDDGLCQLFSDAMGKPIVRAATVEATALGAGILAAAGAGLFASVEDAARAMAHLGRAFSPGPSSAAYERLFTVYRAIYPALAETMAALGRALPNRVDDRPAPAAERAEEAERHHRRHHERMPIDEARPHARGALQERDVALDRDVARRAATEAIDHLVDGLVAIFRVLLDPLLHVVRELHRRAALVRARDERRRRDFPGLDGEEHRVERRHVVQVVGEAEQLVEEDGQAVDVAPSVERLAARLLGGHVRRRPEEGAHPGPVEGAAAGSRRLGSAVLCRGVGGLIVELPREAPVHDGDLAPRPDHDVRGLDVAVDHAARVGVGDRLEHAEEDLDPPLEAEARVGERVAGGELLDDRLERLALDVLHHEEVLPLFVDADVVNRDDVRVLHAPDRADLVDEADEVTGRAHVGLQALDRDGALDVVVLRSKHLANPALTEETALLVARSIFVHELRRGDAARRDPREDRAPPERPRRGHRRPDERRRRHRLVEGLAGDGRGERARIVDQRPALAARALASEDDCAGTRSLVRW